MKKILLSAILLALSNPLLAKAAEHGAHTAHHGPDMNALIASIVDFGIFAGIIYVFGRKPIKEMLKNRKKAIETDVNRSKIEKEKIEQELLAIEGKVSGLTEEISLFKDVAQKSLLNKQEMIAKNSKDSILNLNEGLEKQKVAIVESAKLSLQKDMTQKAIIIAEEKIKKILLKDKMAEVKLLKQFKIS